MVNLSEVPGKFLDQRKWKSLRKAASRELIALAYINAPYPDEADPSDFFWDRRGSPEEAVRCYRTGRSLLDECRHLLSVGELLATGVDKKTGELKAISPREWINIWPMFATDTAVGPNSEYTEIKIYEAPSETIRGKLTSDCIRWLKGQRIAGVKPPVASRFKPGISGNAKGRRNGSKNLKTLIREAMTANISIQDGPTTRRASRIEGVVLRQLQSALKGNDRSAMASIKMALLVGLLEDSDKTPAEASALSAEDEQILQQLLNRHRKTRRR